MNNKIKLIASALLVLSSATYSFAQVSATATVTSTVITPIAISNSGNMSFGSIAVSPTTAGTVTLTPAGLRSITGGVTLPAITLTVSAASFAVTGLAASTYAITLPSTATDLASGTNHMSVNAFTSTPSGTGLLNSGTQTINVGATLNVAAAQAPGAYLSATPFTVTVNYN